MARQTSANAAPIAPRRPFGAQFRNLELRQAWAWPTLPRQLLLLLVTALVVGLLWVVWLRHLNDELDAARQREVTLRADYRAKLQKAVSLEELKKQRAQVMQYVTLLEKQLPNKAEMDALLSDINQAGLGRSLQFELFRPGQIVVREYYAELPIAVRVTGKYHDMGAFAADIAHLSRIVTLNDISIGVTAKDKDKLGGSLTMDATARTFRYLDGEEVQAQRKAATGAKK